MNERDLIEFCRGRMSAPVITETLDMDWDHVNMVSHCSDICWDGSSCNAVLRLQNFVVQHVAPLKRLKQVPA